MKKGYLKLVMLAALALSASAANATLYTFNQTGFEEGASISGSFELNDLNANGHIMAGKPFLGYNLNEISSLTLSFSGNSLVGAFTHTLSDLTLLSYKLSDNVLGNDLLPAQELIGTNWFSEVGYAYSAGIGTGFGWAEVEDLETGVKSFSENNLVVNAVPVPGAVWLFGTGLAGFLGLKRRQA